MHIHFLDPYRPRSSPIHRLDSRIKFVLILAYILAAALLPIGAWASYGALYVMILLVEYLSALGVGYVLKRSALTAPFVLAALPVIFTVRGPALAYFPFGLAASSTGLERFASIALKSWLSVQAAVVLAATTTFPELLIAMRAVRLPRLLVALFGLMWRYLFIFADEVLRMTRARAARSGQSDLPGAKTGGSIAWRARVTGGMAGSLFLRAFERSDRIYMAMLARGYDGEVRTLPLPAIRPAHWLVFFAGLTILVLLLVLSFLI